MGDLVAAEQQPKPQQQYIDTQPLLNDDRATTINIDAAAEAETRGNDVGDMTCHQICCDEHWDDNPNRPCWFRFCCAKKKCCWCCSYYPSILLLSIVMLILTNAAKVWRSGNMDGGDSVDDWMSNHHMTVPKFTITPTMVMVPMHLSTRLNPETLAYQMNKTLTNKPDFANQVPNLLNSLTHLGYTADTTRANLVDTIIRAAPIGYDLDILNTIEKILPLSQSVFAKYLCMPKDYYTMLKMAVISTMDLEPLEQTQNIQYANFLQLLRHKSFSNNQCAQYFTYRGNDSYRDYVYLFESNSETAASHLQLWLTKSRQFLRNFVLH